MNPAHPPEEAFALVMLAFLLLALAAGACARRARAEGKSLREWLDGLR